MKKIILLLIMIMFTCTACVGIEAANNRYEEGREEGYEKGYDVGFEEGKDEGYDEGYINGYVDGAIKTEAVIQEALLEEVTSSFIEKCSYIKPKQIVFVRFSSGSLYAYYDVPQEVYDEFMNADSLGTYLNTELKKHYFAVQIE